MNDPMRLFFQRRSVRRFAGGAIERKTLENILAAGMSAPSACGKDPWSFIVVENHELRVKIAAALPNGGFLPEAAAGIVVCGDLGKAHGGELSYLLQDCSAAIENILLATAASGLGACWLGVHPREDRIACLRELFDLGAAVIPVGIIALGNPGENPPPRNRYSPELVCWR